ncbi:hypothetical protein RHGRI_031150 [Rhododendron griersonianum]|uniref:Protein kinase domain-containing protein n=1 Tax=Rhododendron griersonianum TaxID=479676 RepID=A0AAV6IBG7_9ERIC|nr:hypothetical protein RHGRI_031150 [Rhododendron griersonianum]
MESDGSSYSSVVELMGSIQKLECLGNNYHKRLVQEIRLLEPFGAWAMALAVGLDGILALALRYKIIKEVGDGTFGRFWRAINKQTGEIVAIKKMKRKYYSWEECINLREVKECNLYHLIKDRGKLFLEAEIRNWCFQVFQGLAYMHQQGYFHRDLKPGIVPLKSCFSLQMYNSAIDMWAMGAIMAELFTLHPLFPGSNEADEIYKICSIIGTPTETEWAEGIKLASAINYQFPQVTGVHLSELIPSASKDTIDLITGCLYVPPSLRLKTAVTRTPPSGTRRMLEQKSVKGYSGTLSTSKPASKFSPAKSHEYLTTGVQHKLEMNNQDEIKNHRFSKIAANQPPRYRPPARNSPTSICNGKTAFGVFETAEKLANMNLGSGRVPARQSFPAPMKAGGRHAGQPNMAASQEFHARRTFTRKVVG